LKGLVKADNVAKRSVSGKHHSGKRKVGIGIFIWNVGLPTAFIKYCHKTITRNSLEFFGLHAGMIQVEIRWH